jgi:GNAT superfamily N-acetyltransferase
MSDQGGFVLAGSGLHDLSDADLAALVERTIAHFRGLGQNFEWKTFAHDDPRVVDALTRRGLVPEAPEALVLGRVEDLTGPEIDLPGVGIRVGRVDDLSAVAAMEEEVWSTSWDWFVSEMTERLRAPESTHLVLAEADGRVVSAAWLVPMTGTACAGFWGGSTLREYRGRGVYGALVRARANEAARRGYELIHVDASDDSRPILERLGLHVVGTTTPYIWRS